jgi:meiotically up-regulated gene 157 (Mug157) protein
MRPGVAVRKWEIDSLCYPIRLAHGFWKATGSTVPFDTDWHAVTKLIIQTFREQQRMKDRGPYHFQRNALSPTDSLALGGYGNPVKPNGLICSAFRPSDDACVYPYLIPANLFAVKTLERIAEMVAAIYHDADFSRECMSLAGQVRAAVRQHGVIRHPSYGEILAYEVDGYGNALCMDDANAPSLLSLAYLELLPINDPLYQRTRTFTLSFDNPYYFRGRAAEGTGGPHVGIDFIWPMSIIMRALTSTSDAEIRSCLHILCTSTAGTNMMHESFYKDDPTKYTRPWFAWANSLFGELVLKLRSERPHLLRDFSIGPTE